MKNITELFNWFNGKKTIIGAAIMLSVKFLTQVIVVKANYEPHWLEVFLYALEWIGDSLTSVGFAHKAVKLAEDSNKVN